MHELSIALEIVEMAEEEVERRGAERVNAVHLRLGPLAGVVQEALVFSYDLSCEGTRLEGSRLVIEQVPVRVFCPLCRAEREPASIQKLHCRVCGSPAPEVLQGRELEVFALEIA